VGVGYRLSRVAGTAWCVIFTSLYMLRMCIRDLDLSTSAIESALCPLVEHVSCDLCRHGFEDRIRALTGQWSIVKVSL
jgi:hypothetical protein